MYLVELGKQVVEWRIITSGNNTECFSRNKYPLSSNDLLTRDMGDYKRAVVNEIKESLSQIPKVKFTWTGKKIELTELIYAWEKAGCFNHGNVSIKEIVAYIEIVFNIDLGDYYHAFLDMRIRAGSRTAFLDKLIKFLNERMDDVDRKK